MASRIAVASLRASGSSVRATLPRAILSRGLATPSERPPPAERASELIAKMPSSPNVVTKTGAVVLSTGLLATAISQELYVVNEETVVAAGFFILVAYLSKLMKEPYTSWAEGHIDRIRGILTTARTEHTDAVKRRIDSVAQMKDVVAVTKDLFALSKETATLESQSFVQQQKVALASELKTVLDSWVRFEQQQKEAEQADLARSVIAKVMASIDNDKTQREILLGAVGEVEQLVKSKAI